jgi:hypothetical protein
VFDSIKPSFYVVVSGDQRMQNKCQAAFTFCGHDMGCCRFSYLTLFPSLSFVEGTAEVLDLGSTGIHQS